MNAGTSCPISVISVISDISVISSEPWVCVCENTGNTHKRAGRTKRKNWSRVRARVVVTTGLGSLGLEPRVKVRAMVQKGKGNGNV